MWPSINHMWVRITNIGPCISILKIRIKRPIGTSLTPWASKERVAFSRPITKNLLVMTKLDREIIIWFSAVSPTPPLHMPLPNRSRESIAMHLSQAKTVLTGRRLLSRNFIMKVISTKQIIIDLWITTMNMRRLFGRIPVPLKIKRKESS